METQTVVIIAVATVGLFLLYESIQQQAAVQDALLAKVASQSSSSGGTFGILTPFIGPILTAVL